MADETKPVAEVPKETTESSPAAVETTPAPATEENKVEEPTPAPATEESKPEDKPEEKEEETKSEEKTEDEPVKPIEEGRLEHKGPFPKYVDSDTIELGFITRKAILILASKEFLPIQACNLLAW